MATYKEAADALLAAIQNLNQAYKSANLAEDKDEIFATIEVLQDELNAISIQGLIANGNQYQALTDAFKQSAAKLQQVQNDINKYVKYVKLASDVIATLAKVAALLA